LITEYQLREAMLSYMKKETPKLIDHHIIWNMRLRESVTVDRDCWYDLFGVNHPIQPTYVPFVEEESEDSYRLILTLRIDEQDVFNYCFAYILINTFTGSNTYYYLGQENLMIEQLEREVHE